MKCGRCGNNVFDSKAYLKMSSMEQKQQEIVNKIENDLKQMKSFYGKSDSIVRAVQKDLDTERKVLKAIQQCKNTLYGG